MNNLPGFTEQAALNERGPFLILVALLTIVGLGAATFRHQAYDIPWLPGATSEIWQIDARIEFETSGDPTQVQLALPPEQSGFQLLSESAASSGWGFQIEASQDERIARWSQRSPRGRHVLFYKLAMATNQSEISSDPPGEQATVVWDEPYLTSVTNILNQAYPSSADAHTLTTQLIQILADRIDQNVSLLNSNFERHDLLVRILNTAGVPARVAQVLSLEDGRRRQSVVPFVQIWDDSYWRLYDPELGLVTDTNKLIWQAATPAVLEVLGARNSRVSFSMISETQSATLLAQEQAGDLALSLYSLPIAEQGMFQLIMLLPVGALVVAMLRVLVGIRTSGTFMPVLIALAFLQTELVPGLSSFVIVVAIGLIIRSYLSSLNLLLVARIAVLVVIVIGIISIFSILSYRLGLIEGLTITFFPMIILAWTIERMSITWEEEGPKEVLVQGGGSLFVAVIAYLIMSQPMVEHLVFHFPELHLVLVSVIMLVGRYTGYRLLELRRFADFDNSAS